MPITALCFYGPLSMLVDLAQFGPFWSLFLHLFGPNKGSEWPKIWYNGTGYYHTVLVLGL